MLRLKDRQKQIPNGIFFYVPQTKWRSQPGSFSSVVSQVQRHLSGNPLITKQLNWQTDAAFVENLVDNFNARVCEKMGWTNYYVTNDGPASTGVSAPKTLPRNNPEWSPKLAVVAGANTLRDWFGAGMAPVSQEIAVNRAAVCAACPKNTKNQSQSVPGDWTQYFTKPAADFIRKQIEKRKEMKLSTPHDDKIDVCDACLCPLHLKVHTPIIHIRNRMPEPVKAELHPDCWVIKEI